MPYSTIITFDGSLSGGGATLQVGVASKVEAGSKPIVAYWADQWTADDLELVSVVLGDSAGQARLEALTLLIRVATWRPLLAASQGTLTFIGDAPGVLHDALRFDAREPILNGLGERWLCNRSVRRRFEGRPRLVRA